MDSAVIRLEQKGTPTLVKSLIGRRAYNIIKLINILESYDEPLSVLSLATSLQASKKTVQRYVKILRDHGYNIVDMRRHNKLPSQYKLEKQVDKNLKLDIFE